jgi:hypothetical protein
MTRLQLSKQFKCCQDFNKYIIDSHGIDYLEYVMTNKDLKDIECKLYLEDKARKDAIQDFINELDEAFFIPMFRFFRCVKDLFSITIALIILGDED